MKQEDTILASRQITPETLQHTERWQGMLLGIVFEIVRWNGQERDRVPDEVVAKMESPIMKRLLGNNYNYYISLVIDQIPKKFDPESFWLLRVPAWTEEDEKQTSKDEKFLRLHESSRSLLKGKTLYHYDEHPIIGEIYFHEGITFYERQCHDGETRVVKLGCDFVHFEDLSREEPTLEEILEEVKQSIYSVYALMPGYNKKDKHAGKDSIS